MRGDIIKEYLVRGDIIKEYLVRGDIIKEYLVRGDIIKEYLVRGGINITEKLQRVVTCSDYPRLPPSGYRAMLNA